MAGSEGWVPSSYIELLAAPSTLNMQNTYKAWAQAVQLAFHPSRPAAPTPTAGTSTSSNKPKAPPFPPKVDRKTFPWLPPEICSCEEPSCWLIKQNPTGLGACRHDVETLLKGAGEEYNAAWLWKMSLKWHPDRFMRKFKENFMEEGLGAVGEMFGFFTDLANKEREREKVRKT